MRVRAYMCKCDYDIPFFKYCTNAEEVVPKSANLKYVAIARVALLSNFRKCSLSCSKYTRSSLTILHDQFKHWQ